MLKTLVKKFKSHSLNEEEQDQQGDNATSGAQNPNADTTAPNVGHHICCQRQENDGFLHPNHDHRLRRHCCHQKQASTGPRNCYPCRREKKKSAKVVSSCDKDSGTESDEELEYIETNSTHSVPVSQTSDYYASQQSLSVNSCRSSHCGSPLLGLSDQECNSWESIGSESGMNLRAASKQQQPHQPTANFNANGIFNYEYLLSPSYKNISSTTPAMITEELPNHHYHTRQQFQRLKQQISMKNGLVSSDSIQQEDDSGACRAATPFTYNTAFSPFSRAEFAFAPFSAIGTTPQTVAAAPEKSPGGSSSVDELEEINDHVHKRPIDGQTSMGRRFRSSTLSTASGISSSGVSTWSSGSSSSAASSGIGLAGSEKRKWSQMRQQQKLQKSLGADRCNCQCCCCVNGNCETAAPRTTAVEQQPRTVLHAARKTPVKLLYCATAGVLEQEQKGVVAPNVDLAKPKKIDQSDQPILRNTRFSSRKKCRSDDEPKSIDIDDEEGSNGFVKRPSLDFNKMRAKRVGQKGSGVKNSRRSKSYNGAFLKSKFKGDQQNGYHLRSAGRQSFLFRPLDPPPDCVSSVAGPSTGVDRHPVGFPTNWFSIQKPFENMNCFG